MYLNPNSSLPRFNFATATTLLSSLHQFRYNLLNQSALAFLREEVLRVIGPLPIKQECLSTSSLKDYLQDTGAWFIGKINYVLDRLDFEEQIVRMIPKTENTSKHNYNQNNTINNMVRAIKAIWSVIQSGQTRGWLHCWYRKINSKAIPDSVC